MIKLRPYQKSCIDKITEHFKTNDKQLIQLPTGAGKTFIFLHYLKYHSVKTLIAVPSIELLEQVVYWGKIILNDRSVESYKSGKKADVIVTTSHALNFDRQKERFNDFDHLIIDEAHHAQSKTYRSFINELKHKFKLLGCTATPERNDGKSLLEIFGHLTFDMNLLDLIKSGELADLIGTRIMTNIKLDGQVRKGGDIIQKKLKELDSDSRNKIITKCFEDECKNKKTLIFCVSIDQTIKLANDLKALGYRAEFIYGDMNKKQRKEVLERFKSGETQVLTNCQLLTEGFDEPTIEALIIGRPTLSKTLYSQMIGRGVRKTKDKDVCYVYELTDNIHDLCNFNVFGTEGQSRDVDYAPGTRLTDHVKYLESLDSIEVSIHKIRYDIFGNLSDVENNRLILFDDIPQTGNQLNLLKHLPYADELTHLESAFLIWKNNLRKKYGFNHS